MKFIALLIIFFVVLLAMRWWNIHQTRLADKESKEARRPKQVNDNFVRCERCGAHVPRAEATMTETGWVCSDNSCKPTPS